MDPSQANMQMQQMPNQMMDHPMMMEQPMMQGGAFGNEGFAAKP